MRTIREIMRLHFEHDLSQRAIARACAVSPTTVGYYIEKLQQSGSWAAICSLVSVRRPRLFSHDFLGYGSW
jgi:Sigma-70, region 4.